MTTAENVKLSLKFSNESSIRNKVPMPNWIIRVGYDFAKNMQIEFVHSVGGMVNVLEIQPAAPWNIIITINIDLKW